MLLDPEGGVPRMQDFPVESEPGGFHPTKIQVSQAVGEAVGAFFAGLFRDSEYV